MMVLLLKAYWFMVGACIGSFLNVCIYRIPLNRSVVHPRSRCYHCGKPIPWYRNIPILTWLVLGGKSACCHKSLPFRYVLVEILTALFFLFCWQTYEGGMLYASLIYGSILIPIIFIDIDHQIIPDRFSIGGALVGLMLSAIFPQIHGTEMPIEGLYASLCGLLIGSSILLWVGILAQILVKREAIGFGDIKLLGCVGAFCGWKGAVFAIFGGSIIGTLIIVPVAILQRLSPHWLSRFPRLEMGSIIPFGPFLAIAGFLYFTLPWFGNSLFLRFFC